MPSENLNEPLEFVPPNLELIGQLLPAYSFESLIAQGGMGAVYKATQISLDRPVAVKILPPELAQSTSFRESFETEAKLMARLNHPNLIGVYDFGEVEGMLFIVMEFVKGGCLFDKTYNAALGQIEALEVTIAICNGLENAHEAGILHRDIKPANIFITENGTPKIGDFGLARPSDKAETGVIYGTPGYAAPEVINEPEQVGPATDIFSVGVMLYELITGKMPEEIYQPVTHFNPECDPSIDEMIHKATSPTLQNRYQTAKEFSDKLDSLHRKLTRPEEASAPATAKPAVANPLLTPATSGTPRPISPRPPITPRKPAKKSSGARNFIIILLLLGAIYATYQWKDQKEKKHAEITAANEAAAAEIAKKNALAKSTKTNHQPSETRKTIETLSALKARLLAGERPLSEMPESGVTLDDGKRFICYVDKSLMWAEADRWCQQHGGYLATLDSEETSELVSSIIPLARKAWFGAATVSSSQWAWVDGSKWNDFPELENSSQVSYAQTNNDQLFDTATGTKRAGFLIEWRMDGSNPGSLEDRMSRAADSSAYPAGSFQWGEHRYYICPTRLTLQEASKFATLGGAHLAAFSDDSEKEFLKKFIPSQIRSSHLCRLGGKRAGSDWTWLNGETWKLTNWKAGSPKNANSLACSGGKDALWKDIPDTKKADFTLFEWSSDGKAKALRRSSNADISKLQKKATELLTKERDAYEQKCNSLATLIQEELDDYLEGLQTKKKEATAPIINEIKEDLAGDKYINENLVGLVPNSTVKKLLTTAAKQQEKLDKDYDRGVDKIRKAYQARLEKIIATLKKKKQLSALKEAQEELKQVSKSRKIFLEFFL